MEIIKKKKKAKKKKKKMADNHFYNMSRRFDVFTKICAIITYQHCIYESPQELPNELRLSIL